MVLGILRDYPQRALLGLVLMTAQAFFYNAIFFSYALVLTRFYAVPSASVGWYILPFALGNFLGPLLLGPLFDTLGRKPMIGATYALSGILLAIVGWLFREGLLDAVQLTACWTVIFFFASAAASSAYLTVSESFPLEARALAIALFYALGTATGGVVSPWLFGILVGTGERSAVFRRLPLRRRPDDRGSDHGIRNRRQGRAPAPGKRRPPALQHCRLAVREGRRHLGWSGFAPQFLRGQARSFRQCRQLGPDDARMDLAGSRKAGEAAIGAGNDVFAADDAGEPRDPLGDRLRMFDEVGGMGDDAGDQ